MTDHFATLQDRNFRQSNAKEIPDFQELTGWVTPVEMQAFEKGKEVEERMIIRFIQEWQGETNSELGKILSAKFEEMGKNLQQ